MWKELTIAFAIAHIASLVATEILRELVDRGRVRRTGVGGTQDIAIWGTAVAGLCMIGWIVSGIGWYLGRS